MPYGLPHISLDHIPDEDLRGIGLVAEAWAYLEGALERICWLMAELRVEALGLSLTTHMTHRSRYDAACTLVNEQFPDSEPHKKLKSMQQAITQDLSGKRNLIVHSRLHGLSDISPRPYRIVYKARGRVTKKAAPVDLEEYEHVAAEILAATNQVIDIFNELVAMVIQRDGSAPPWTYRPDQPD